MPRSDLQSHGVLCQPAIELACEGLAVGRFGSAIAWFATSVSTTPVRFAALNRISLTGRAHASASTQIDIY